MLALALAGCGSNVNVAVKGGLANAPRLGETRAAELRVDDVIANGDNACGVEGVNRTPLRGHYPACTNVEKPPARDLSTLMPRAASDDLSVPLPTPYYGVWLCWERAQRAHAESNAASLRVAFAESLTCGEEP